MRLRRAALFVLLIVVVGLVGVIFWRVETSVPSGHVRYVTYDQAAKLLCSGQVKTAGQTHGLAVTLDLNNGTSISTVEPRIDMIFQECSNCGDVCKGITFWTE